MVAQLFANGLATGSLYALSALGFGLIYNTTRVFHIAYGAIYTVSAYLLFALWAQYKIPLGIALIIASILTMLLGILIDIHIYQPLLRQGSSFLIVMISSLAVYIITVNIIALIFGNETKVLRSGVATTFSLGQVILSDVQILQIVALAFAFLTLVLSLKWTNLGKIIRAMRDNPDLLSLMGIDLQKVRWLIFGLGSLLAGLAAMLQALDVGIDPNIGMSAVLIAAVAVIIGGVGILEAPAFGGLLLGVLQSVVIWQASGRWQEAVTFTLLILFLLFKPEGIFGQRRRLEEK
jgi:branched-chain amino acid transport system permease protein